MSHFHQHNLTTADPDSDSPHLSGQATTEYALVLLVAAVIALLVIAWATTGGGGGRIGDLFDAMFDMILQRADSSQ